MNYANRVKDKPRFVSSTRQRNFSHLENRHPTPEILNFHQCKFLQQAEPRHKQGNILKYKIPSGCCTKLYKQMCLSVWMDFYSRRFQVLPEASQCFQPGFLHRKQNWMCHYHRRMRQEILEIKGMPESSLV